MTIRLSELPGGLRVLTHAMPGFESAAVSVYVNAGARSEADREHGLAHLLEHMAFKGTERRSARDIAEEIEDVGGDLNADTSYERTGYHARVLAADVPLALDILADITVDPAFDPAELEREHGVIAQEIGSVEDTPDDLVFEHLRGVAFPGQTIGRPILGTVESVTALDRDDLVAFHGRQHRRADMLVVAAGAVEHDAVLAEAARRLDKVPDGTRPPDQPARYAGGQSIADRRLEQLHLTIGFEGVDVHSEDLYAAQFFTSAVGGGMSSRLFQEVREKRGLAYSVFAFHWPFADVGLFGVYAGTGPKEAAELVPLLADELMEAAETLGEREIDRVRAQARAGLLMGLENPADLVEQHARHLFLFGAPFDRDDVLRRVEAVTAADVRRVGRKLLSGAPSLSALGPAKRVPDVGRLAERLGTRETAA